MSEWEKVYDCRDKLFLGRLQKAGWTYADRQLTADEQWLASEAQSLERLLRADKVASATAEAVDGGMTIRADAIELRDFFKRYKIRLDLKQPVTNRSQASANELQELEGRWGRDLDRAFQESQNPDRNR